MRSLQDASDLGVMMKLALKSETVFEMFREMQGTEKYGSMGPKAPNPDGSGIKYIPFHGVNYLVYDEHKDAPPGFALRVGRTAAVFLVDKRVAGKKLKIPVGLAAGKKGTQKLISLTEARDQAWGLAQLAKKHGANPKGIADKVDAAELTFRQVWDDYITDLKARDTPPSRKVIISMLGELESTPVATQEERLAMLDTRQLYGRGCGFVDISLLASTLLIGNVLIWTLDKRFELMAGEFDKVYRPVLHS